MALSLRPDAHSRSLALTRAHSLAPLCASLVRQAVTFSSRVQVGGPEKGYTSDLLNFTAPTSEVTTLQDIADLSAKTQESLTAFGTDILINGSWGVTVAFAFGLAITVLAFATGHISGGQLNPAVTFALALVGQLPAGQAVANTISQIVGAILGSALLMATIPDGNEGTLGSNVIAPGVGFGNALCGEIVMTSVLVATVLETAVSKGNGALLVLTSLLAQVTRRAPAAHPPRTRRAPDAHSCFHLLVCQPFPRALRPSPSALRFSVATPCCCRSMGAPSIPPARSDRPSCLAPGPGTSGCSSCEINSTVVRTRAPTLSLALRASFVRQVGPYLGALLAIPFYLFFQSNFEKDVVANLDPLNISAGENEDPYAKSKSLSMKRDASAQV